MQQRALYRIPFEEMTFEVRRRPESPARKVIFKSRGTPARAFAVMQRYGFFAARLVQAEDDVLETRWELLNFDGPEEQARALAQKTAALYRALQAAADRETASRLKKEYGFYMDICVALKVDRLVRGYIWGVNPERDLPMPKMARRALGRQDHTF